MPVIRTDSFTPDFSVPVVIIGAGACGLTAAIAAKRAGAEVIVLERDAHPAGSTAMSYGGICAAGTQAQDRAGISDTGDALREDIMTVTRGQTDPDLARTIAANCGPAVDWLTGDLGLDLQVETHWTGLGHRQPRLHMPPGRSGEVLMGMLLRAAEEAGVDILTRARVTDLYADADDRILGVRIERPDSVELLGCDQLVLASCGFGANEDLVARHMPELDGARYYGHEGNEGDALLWGEALGAATGDLGSYQALGSLSDPESIVVPHTLLIGGGVQVNTDGKRFEDELDDISGQALTILKQPGGVCWVVYDDRLHKQALDIFDEYREGDKINAYRTAGTWRDLAALMHVPADTLDATMTHIEGLKAAGGTDDFGRPFTPEQALVPPFYAVKVTGALFHTQGGLCVDGTARVVRPDGSAFPNLYAGGGAARSVSGPSVWGYLPGMGLCTAVTLGKLAGETAAHAL